MLVVEWNVDSQLMQALTPRRLVALEPGRTKAPRTFPSHDIRSRLCSTHPSTVVSDLSDDLREVLGDFQDLSEAIIQLLADSDVLYTSPFAACCMVFRVSEGIAVKVTVDEYIQTEYRTLAYLQEHLPNFPAPKLHGVIRLGRCGLLFSSLIPGTDLDKAWPQLADADKRAISAELDSLLADLRSLPHSPGTPLGGVGGQGCKDTRRFIRTSSEPIMDVKQFEDFIFSGSKVASPLYIRFLRDLIPTPPAKVVFTHGDIRPAISWWTRPNPEPGLRWLLLTGTLAASTPSTGSA
jgi:hypothetical protein